MYTLILDLKGLKVIASLNGRLPAANDSCD